MNQNVHEGFIWFMVFLLSFCNLYTLTKWSEEQDAFIIRAESIYYAGCSMSGSGMELETGIIETCEKLSKEYGKVWINASPK